MKRWIALAALASFLVIFSYEPLFADDSWIGGKIDQVLKNQDEILKQLAEIKAELQIVKIRATR